MKYEQPVSMRLAWFCCSVAKRTGVSRCPSAGSGARSSMTLSTAIRGILRVLGAAGRRPDACSCV
eukprot:6156950-Lingulodinium_polyedra.AAC.1